MDSPSPRSRWLFVQGAAGLALLALFALFFFVWVPERRARLTERHFRLLAESGDQIRSAIGTLYTSLTNAASAAVGARLGELTGVVGVDDVERALEAVVPALHIVRRPELEPTTDRFRQVTLGLRRDLKHRWLHFDYVEAAPVGNSTNGNSPGTLRFAVQTDLGRLIEPTVVHHGFDDVLLTSEDGAVMYQSSGGALRVTRLPVSSEAVAGSAVRGADTNYLVTAATLGEIRVAGTDYHLFAQPLHFSLPYATGPTNAVFQWVIAGLVKSRTFRAQTMTVPNTAIILLIFAVALVLLSWPFFNVVLAGPRDELRSSHAFGAAASSFLACGALMLLLLDWAGHSRFGDRMDADLRSFAETLTTNLSRELDAVNRQLIEFDQHVANAPALRLNRTNVLAGQMAPYPFLRMAVWVSGAGQQLFKWATGPGVTPFVPVGDRAYFRAIVEDRAWPRGLARQPGAIAVTNRFFLEPIYSRTRGENVAVFSLASRAGAPSNATPAAVVYGEFRPLSLMGAVVPAGFGFCVVDESGRALFHSDERRNLQENFVEECEGHPRLRAAMSARTTDEFDARYFRRPHRLRVAPLPGFPWTLVAFRDERPVDTARLEMLSTAAILFALYGLLMLGGLSVAFLRHRRGAPVWLWPDRERTPAYRWVMVANLVITVLFGVGLLVFTSPAMRLAQALLLPIIAVCFAYRVLKSDHWRKDPWQWFENRRAKLAQRVDRLRQETSVRLGGAPDETSFSRQRPVRALATLGRVVERFPWPPRSRRAYLACFGSLLAVVALFPVVAFYQMTFQDEVERFVKRAQLQLARDLAERIEEARADSRQQPTVEAAEVFLRVRLATDWDRYDGAALETETRLAATPTEPLPRVDALDQLLLGVRPHYNEIDEANAGLIFPAAADGSWRSSVEAGRLTLTLASGAGLNGQQPLEITSLLPELRWPGRAGDGLLWPAGLLLVLATPFCLTRLIARRVFLLHVRRPAVATAESAPASALGSLVHLRVGRPAPEPASGLATKDPFVAEEATHFRFIDLKSAADRAFLARPRRHGLERDAVLVFANLETTWDEPDCAAKKETWLRGLSRDHAKTLMALAADPAAPASSPRDATARHAVAREAAVQHERHWADCSPLEQLTLLQVARTGHANSERPELRTLLARGLLRRDPELRLQNESFRRFVLARGRPEGPLPEEARESATSWHNLKGALWVMLTGLAVFLFLTQREAWNVVIGLASAFMVGVNSLSQLSKLLPKAKEPKA